MATSAIQAADHADRGTSMQFSIRSLLFVVVLVASFLAWCNWFGLHDVWEFYPGIYGLCSIGVLLFACFQLRSNAGCASAWNFAALGWFVVLANVLEGIYQVFRVTSCDDPIARAELIQRGVYISIVTSLTIPLFVTLAIGYVLVICYRSRPRTSPRWISLSLLVAMADVALFVVLFSFTFGTWGR